MNGCTIRTPASSANLGPGFDSLGVALDLYNVIEVKEQDEGLSFGAGDKAYQNEDNLFLRAYDKTMERLGLKRRGLWISEHPSIPASRGLGSSAATIVAGVVAANFLHGSPLSRDELLGIATELEPHPDNLAPALLGGLRASMMADGRPVSIPLTCEDLLFCALVPPFPLPTKMARAVLPETVPFRDAVFNLSRVTLLARGFEKGDLGRA
ncbi:MAG: homoserine kinase, partial [Clostridia bacterium]|nr:homoserine kinase [Clostridia bacterium]